MVGCPVCDTSALHLLEYEANLDQSVLAKFQRDNYEFSIRDLPTQDLEREVEVLCIVVRELHEELADHDLNHRTIGVWENDHAVGRNNMTDSEDL